MLFIFPFGINKLITNNYTVFIPNLQSCLVIVTTLRYFVKHI